MTKNLKKQIRLMKKMKIILTGANGQVGREIQRYIPEELRSKIKLIPLSHQSLDISDSTAVNKMFADYCPDLIINTAAFTAVDRAETETIRVFAVNTLGPQLLAQGCAELDIPLIQLSTDYIFNGEKKLPYTEWDLPSPMGIYGQSKWQAEVSIANNLAKHIILRTSWVFGYFGHNFVKTILTLAQQQSTIRIVADQIGNPTSARSLAKTIWQLIKKISAREISWGTYHCTNYPTVSWYDFAKAILQQTQDHLDLSVELIPITTADYPTLAKRPAYSVLDCQKLECELGIKQENWQMELISVLRNFFQDDVAVECIKFQP